MYQKISQISKSFLFVYQNRHDISKLRGIYCASRSSPTPTNLSGNFFPSMYGNPPPTYDHKICIIHTPVKIPRASCAWSGRPSRRHCQRRCRSTQNRRNAVTIFVTIQLLYFKSFSANESWKWRYFSLVMYIFEATQSVVVFLDLLTTEWVMRKHTFSSML